jgi:hypothetical protein
VRARRVGWSLAVAVWLAAVTLGFTLMWRYAAAAGAPTSAPRRWPAATRLARTPDAAQLLVFVHAECPCSRASLTELGHLLERKAIPTTVVFAEPRDDSALHRQAERLGVTLFDDNDGSESHRFGAETSGATLLYDRAGTLAFAGGLTASRGNEGSGLGVERLLLLVDGKIPDRADSPVFGCPLHNQETQ